MKIGRQQMSAVSHPADVIDRAMRWLVMPAGLSADEVRLKPGRVVEYRDGDCVMFLGPPSPTWVEALVVIEGGAC